jgi:predicted Fe-S protein YdhL (DUF1289 family)
MPSPCIGVCRLSQGVCEGCGRTKEEIMRWTRMSDEQREEIMKRLEDGTK